MVLASVSRYPSTLGFAGQPQGISEYKSRTYKYTASDTAAVTDVVITAADSTAYTLKIQGVTITVTSDGSATVAEIRAALIAAIQADTYANALVTAAASGSNVRITQRDATNPATIEEGDTNLALTVVTANTRALALPAGIAVAQSGTSDQKCRLMSGGSDQIVGVSILPLFAKKADELLYTAATSAYPPNTAISVLYQGTILVAVEQAVTPADPVYVRYTATPTNPQVGAFRMDADSSKAVQITTARYTIGAGSGGLAAVALNLP